MNYKYNRYSVLLFLGLLLIIAVQSSTFDSNFFEDEQMQYHRRNLGEKKDKYCKGRFVKAKATDPNGNSYESSQLVTQDQRNEAKSIRSKLQIARNKKDSKEDIKKMVNNSDYVAYAMSLIYVAAPFIALLALGIIGSMFYWFCFFLEKFCCKRDLHKNPYTDSDLGRPASCVFFFGLAAIGTIIYGYIIASDFANMNSVLECSVISVLDEVVSGAKVGTYEWLGLSNAEEPLKSIIFQLDDAALKQEQRFSDTAWISQDLEDLDNTNQGIFEYYTGKKVPNSPNPNTASSIGVESLYIRDGLGPTSQTNTTTNQIQMSLNTTTRKFAEAALLTEQSSSDIKLNVESLKDVLNQGRKNIASTNNQFLQTIKSAEKKLADLGSKNDLVNTGLMIFFGAQLFGALLGFLGVSFTHCTGPRPKCRVLLHLGWFIMSLMMIIGLLISSFLMPVGVMLTETCTWMEDFLKDEKEFNDPSYTFLNRDLMNKISVCKFGNGNLNSEFGMDQEMNKLTLMLTSLEKTTTLNDPASPNYIKLESTLQAVDIEISKLQGLINGEVTDSDATNDDNSAVSIDNLNKWADHSLTGSWQKQPQIGNCAATQDEYVFVSNKCKYTTKYDKNQAVNQNYGSQTCITVSDLSLLDQATRYAQITATPCDSQVEQKLQQYFLALFRYDMSRKSFFGSIQGDIISLKTKIDKYNKKLLDFVDISKGYQSDISKLAEAVNDPQKGLMSRFNCKFLGSSLDRVFDAVCVNYVSPVFKVILATAVASVSMFFASFFSFCLAIRYARKVRPVKVQKQKLKKPKKNLEKEKAKGVKKEKVKPKGDKKDAKRSPTKKKTSKTAHPDSKKAVLKNDPVLNGKGAVKAPKSGKLPAVVPK